MNFIIFIIFSLFIPFYLKAETDPYEQLLSNFYASPTIYPASVMIFNSIPQKQLVYIASHHTNNLNSSIHQTIKNLIEKEKPDICIVEGFTTSEGINPKRIIEISNKKFHDGICGENCYLVTLCQHYKIPFIGGDTQEKDYIELFKPYGISEEDIVFYLLAQQIPFWHRDGEFSHSNFKTQFEAFMKDNISDWLDIPPVSYTYDDFLNWNIQHIGRPYNPEHDFIWENNKLANESLQIEPYLGEGATIYQKICAYTIYVRDRNLIQLIEKLMTKHSKVLIVYGATHYLNQKCILEFQYGQPTKTWLIIDEGSNGIYFLD